MERVITTLSPSLRGDYLTPATGLTGGSAVYAFAAIPGADTVAAVIDLDPGTAPNTAPANASKLNAHPRLLCLPTISMADGAAAFDFVSAWVGFDVLPATFTAAGYRGAGDVVFPAKRYTQTLVNEGEVNKPAVVLHRYMAHILTPLATGVAPAVDMTSGLKWYNNLDNSAFT